MISVLLSTKVQNPPLIYNGGCIEMTRYSRLIKIINDITPVRLAQQQS